MNIKDIRAMHEVEEKIVDDPHLPRGKAISMLQRAHQQRGWLLEEVERLQQFVAGVEETYLEALCEAQRERDEALARCRELEKLQEAPLI